MIERIDHIAIAVRDYHLAYEFFTKVLGAIPGSGADNHEMMYRWQNLGLGDMTRLELLGATGEGSFLEGFLKNRDGGVHHITLQTRDIEAAKNSLEQKGIPIFGFKSYGSVWNEFFIHPRDAFGVLIQIAEFNPSDWIPGSLKMPAGKKFRITAAKKGILLEYEHPGGSRAGLNLTRDEALSLRDELDRILPGVEE